MTTGAQARATVVSGGGRFADPWHPFPETSGRLGALAEEAGFVVEVLDDVAAAVERPAQLLILNVGRPEHPDDREDRGIRAALLDVVERGAGLLSMHSTAMSFPAVPEWEGITGGVWVEGESMHPPYGPAEVRIVDDTHPITARLAGFALDDERYTRLRIDPGVRVLADHDHDGRPWPLIWTPRGRVVVDLLGHDSASYDSAPHRTILTRAMRWLGGLG
jgi:uncharacterized protein